MSIINRVQHQLLTDCLDSSEASRTVLEGMVKSNVFSLVALLWCYAIAGPAGAQQLEWPSKTYYRSVEVRGNRIFYREAGDACRSTIILLHGYPTSSHTYRELIPLLSGRYHVIAPDNLGSGYSAHPDPDSTEYTFDLLAAHIVGLIDALNVGRYTLYLQDFGAPVGYRVILERPERLQALIVQNANAYLDGLTEQRQAFFRKAHDDRSEQSVRELYEFTGRDAVMHRQYLRDVRGREEIASPDSWTHDLTFLQSAADRRIQVELFQDYYNNLLAYPSWQGFLRKARPPTLIVWGRNDPAFIAAGARAYLRDVPDAELHLIDAGHFAVEEKPVEIAKLVTSFMGRQRDTQGKRRIKCEPS